MKQFYVTTTIIPNYNEQPFVNKHKTVAMGNMLALFIIFSLWFSVTLRCIISQITKCQQHKEYDPRFIILP